MKKGLLSFVLILCCMSVCNAFRHYGVYYQEHYETKTMEVIGAQADLTHGIFLERVMSHYNALWPVTNIKFECFANNKVIKVMDMSQARLTSLKERLFYNCMNLDTVYLPESVPGEYFLSEIGTNTFLDCWKLRHVTIPVNLKKICHGAFRRCKKMEHIDLPYTVETIMEYAFAQCESLKSIVLSTGIQYLGVGVFQDCYSLETVEFYNRYGIRIQPCTFENCVRLKNIYFNKENIIQIDSCAFKGCTSLKTFTVPSSVNKGIGASAFEGCTSLDSVTTTADVPPTLGRNAFKNISPTCVLTVPYGRRAAYIAAGWTEDIFKGGIREQMPAGIHDVKVEHKRQGGWYDLQGRPVGHPEKGRMYIRDGRKILVK
ncbi:MAG: leucine-rich repeat domain-containing protein [Bacteroidaceae bacterium]|nr:leucine-rich repeat domain-containing protein [Bacteroidaceae bacterium]